MNASKGINSVKSSVGMYVNLTREGRSSRFKISYSRSVDKVEPRKAGLDQSKEPEHRWQVPVIKVFNDLAKHAMFSWVIAFIKVMVGRAGASF
jgi:hypothetical protein